MIPLVAIVGKSGVGKTTLIEKLIREFKRQGVRVAVIKHHAHATPIDTSGKDSTRLAWAGANPVIVSSPVEVARFERVSQELTLAEIVTGIQNVDLILAEGFKQEPAIQLQVSRAELGLELVARPDKLVAVASDQPVEVNVPRFDIDDASGLARFIIDRFVLVGSN